jgi:hypothetical protein
MALGYQKFLKKCWPMLLDKNLSEVLGEMHIIDTWDVGHYVEGGVHFEGEVGGAAAVERQPSVGSEKPLPGNGDQRVGHTEEGGLILMAGHLKKFRHTFSPMGIKRGWGRFLEQIYGRNKKNYYPDDSLIIYIRYIFYF